MRLTLQVIRLFHQGKTMEEISENLGQPMFVVRQILAEAGMVG